jgi:hypothetical protein
MCAVNQIKNYSTSRGETNLPDSATVSPTKTGLKENKALISTDEFKEHLVSNVSPEAQQTADAVPLSSEEMTNAAEMTAMKARKPVVPTRKKVSESSINAASRQKSSPEVSVSPLTVVGMQIVN